ncbi:MAG: YebC/PmpR family DNA-binding transcriptional regulator [Christensenellales bacterium]|jgi:YebC/PmpR family DNA-binding regulatory protein
MAGHSHASNVAARKNKTDAAKAKIFTKLGREISVVVKEGGSDPVANQRLRDVIAKCRAANMPNDNIQRSIKKAAGDIDGVDYMQINYEGYAPGGVAVMVNTLTDNRNRTVGEVRHAFDKNGGSMGATGCVSYMFDRLGVIIISRGDMDEEEFMMTALEAGASDVEADDEFFEVITDPSDFSQVRENLESEGFEFVSAEVTFIPQNYVEVTDEEALAKIRKMIDMMEDLDDVQEVFHNADIDESE